MPLDFIYESASNSYRLDLYDTEEKLIKKIQTGTGDPALFTGTNFLYIDGIFGATVPKTVTQREWITSTKPIGENDLTVAKVAQYNYYIAQGRNKEINDEAYLGFEQNLRTAMTEWSPTTKAARFILYTEQGYMESWASDVRSDTTNVFVAAFIVFIYIICTLGTFSPIFCRGFVAFCGALSIMMSTSGGFGLLFYAG